MENGHDEKLADKLSELALNQSSQSPRSNDSLLQVIKAVEAAEATIKQQVEENNRLRSELQKKVQELERNKLDESVARRSSGDQVNERAHGPYGGHQLVSGIVNQDNTAKSLGDTPTADPSGMRVVHHHLEQNSDDSTMQFHAESHSGEQRINGTVRGPTGGADRSQLSSPSTPSLSPTRQLDGEHDPRFNLSPHGLMPVAEVNNSSSLWKQDLIHKIREHEEEIRQLRKHLAEYSIKEAQIRNDKYVLEKRIAYMRLAFDQQQQDLVDAASKAVSYRQEIIEENVRLTYALQAAQQERSTFVSSLLPLLAEHSLQPQVSDAQSIVSNVKVLFRHLQEKLLHTESKLKELEHQLAPWHSDVNHLDIAPLSPSPSAGPGLAILNKNALQMVPQPAYAGRVLATSSETQMARDWDLVGQHQGGLRGVVGRNLDNNELGRYSDFATRNTEAHGMSSPLGMLGGEAQGAKQNDETTNKQVTFRDTLSNSDMDDLETERQQNAGEPSANWNSGNTPYAHAPDDPSPSYSPYLTPVLEEPSSSFSEGAEEDPLPAIEGLQISGEAFPGRELQASGYSINGTTSCNFEWVRHMEDGSVKYIDGAKQPNYLITADDVDTYLAIEVQPLDDRKRKGELVKVFANDQRKITFDTDMQSHIERTRHNGHASFKVSMSMGYLGMWEPATLSIKREGYSIKHGTGVAVAEKFSQSTSVTIPYGQPTEFTIGSDGHEHLLRTDNGADVSCSRDTIVLTLRLFIVKAVEKRRGKRKGFLFTK